MKNLKLIKKSQTEGISTFLKIVLWVLFFFAAAAGIYYLFKLFNGAI